MYISFFHHISTFFVFYSKIYCTYIPEKRKLSGDRGLLVSLAFSVIGRWIKEWQKKIPPIKWASSIISQNILLGCIFHDILTSSVMIHTILSFINKKITYNLCNIIQLLPINEIHIWFYLRLRTKTDIYRDQRFSNIYFINRWMQFFFTSNQWNQI